jgi:hypothetical protein
MKTKLNHGGHQQPIDEGGKYLSSKDKEKETKDNGLKRTPQEKALDYNAQKPTFESDNKAPQEEDSLSIIQDLIADEYEAIDGYKYAIEHIHNELIQNEFKTILEEEEKHIKMLDSIKEKLK